MNFFVYIIESPSDEDKKNNLIEGKVLTEYFELGREIQYTYNVVANRKELYEALNSKLIKALKLFQSFPILHFSMHGNEEGIKLTNDFISWHELRSLLLPILQGLNDSLIICMSTCFGIYGCQIAMYQDSKPSFYALIGNNTSVSFQDALMAYQCFYHRLCKMGATFVDCVEAMKIASGNNNFEYLLGKTIHQYVYSETNRRQALDLASQYIQNASPNMQNIALLGDI